MKKFCSSILFSFLLFFSAGVLCAQSLGRETRIDSILASVNGDPITLLDVILETGREEMRLASIYTGERLLTETEKLRKEVLEEIIVRKLVYGEYKRNPFTIDQEYIDRWLDNLSVTMASGTRSSLERKIRDMGITIVDLKDKIKERIAVDVLLMEHCDRPVFITPKDVYEYYSSHPAEWNSPRKFSLQLLLIAKEDDKSQKKSEELCARIKKELSSSGTQEHFAELAKNIPDIPGIGNGNVLGKVEEDKLRPEFSSAVKKAAEGQIIGPVETLEGFYFIRIAGIEAEKKIDYAAAAPKIREMLETKERKKIRDAYTSKLKENAVVKYYF